MEKGEEQAARNGGDQPEVDPVETMDEEAASKEKLTSGDDSKVKFTSVKLDGFDGKNGEAKVDIQQVAQTTVGMGKEELMKYANEPFWIRLRMFLFVFFWLAWIGMLVGAIAIIVMAPRCPPPPKVEWYQKTAMYQVDVQKFKDSDGDAVGDIKGLSSKLDYFKDHNIKAIMLSNFYKSTDSDSIIEHKEIESKIGTLADFDELVSHMKEKDIKLVVDFIPNHSSIKHPWFQKSVERQDSYEDFYVWSGSRRGSPPNNWLSVDGGSAWTWNEERKQFYLHTFGKDKPDFNLRNELVRQELREIIQFWLEHGVDGFRVVAASHLIENENLGDEPLATEKTSLAPEYKDVNHVFTVDQPENAGLFAEWKELLMNFTASTGIHKILAPELSGSTNSSALYYGNATSPLAELPYRTQLSRVSNVTSGVELQNLLEEATDHIPAHGWPTLLLGSKDVQRLASRVEELLVDAYHMVAILAKGTPIMFYGDELGIYDYQLTINEKAPDNVMLWNSGPSAGFINTTGQSELSLHREYAKINAEEQDKDKMSHLSIFKQLLALRGQPAVNFGVQEYPIVTNHTFSLIRVRKGSPGYLVVVNLGKESPVLDFTGKSKYLPDMGRVEIRSGNMKDGPLMKGDHPKVYLNDIQLQAKEAAVLSFVPVFE